MGSENYTPLVQSIKPGLDGGATLLIRQLTAPDDSHSTMIDVFGLGDDMSAKPKRVIVHNEEFGYNTPLRKELHTDITADQEWLERELAHFCIVFLVGDYDKNQEQIERSHIAYDSKKKVFSITDSEDRTVDFALREGTPFNHLFISGAEFQTFLQGILPVLLGHKLYESHKGKTLINKMIFEEAAKLVTTIFTLLNKEFSQKKDFLIDFNPDYTEVELALLLFTAIAEEARLGSSVMNQEDALTTQAKGKKAEQAKVYGFAHPVMISSSYRSRFMNTQPKVMAFVRSMILQYYGIGRSIPSDAIISNFIKQDDQAVECIDDLELTRKITEYFSHYPESVYQFLSQVLNDRGELIKPEIVGKLKTPKIQLDLETRQVSLKKNEKKLLTQRVLQSKNYRQVKNKVIIHLKVSTGNDAESVSLRVGKNEFLQHALRYSDSLETVTSRHREFQEDFSRASEFVLQSMIALIQSLKIQTDWSKISLLTRDKMLIMFVLGQLSQKYPWIGKLEMSDDEQVVYSMGRNLNNIRNRQIGLGANTAEKNLPLDRSDHYYDLSIQLARGLFHVELED